MADHYLLSTLRALILTGLLMLPVSGAVWAKGGGKDLMAPPPTIQLGAIHGAIRLCVGVEATYSVTPVAGVTSYSWTFPPGFTVLSVPANGPSVRVLASSTGTGNISVVGLNAGGTQVTTISTAQVQVSVQPTNLVLLVVGQIPLNAGDADLKIRLQNQAPGYTVREVVDSTTDAAEAGCAVLVYISGSSHAALVGTKFRSVATPVITAETDLFAPMALTSAGGFGQSTGTTVTVTNTTHELGATNPSGPVIVYSSSGNLNWGTPASSAVVIATNPTASASPALFAYEQKTPLVVDTAQARRVAFFADDDGSPRLTLLGDRLLQRSFCWAIRSCPSTVSLATGVLNRATFCPGDTVTVPFTATGSFGISSANTFMAELSNPNGSFVNARVIGRQNGNASGSILATLPLDVPLGTQYRIRVTSTAPGKLGTQNGTNLTITDAGPTRPANITGPDTVCTNLIAAYTAAAVPGALRYEWLLQGGAATTDTTRTAQISFNGVTSPSTIQIQVRVVTRCGTSTYTLKTVRVDNGNTHPDIGAITATSAPCPGVYVYQIPPVPGAIRYTWILPQGTAQVGQGNVIEATYDSARNGQVKVVVTTPCGQTDTARLNVSVPTGGKRALLYAPLTTLGPTEQSIKTRLEQSGYVVTVMTRSTAITSALYCNKVVIVSPMVNASHLIARLDTLHIPIVANHSQSGTDQLSELKLTQPNSSGTFSGSTLTSASVITNPAHPLAAGLIGGFQQMYNNSYQLGWARPEAAAVEVATIPGLATNKTIWTYEEGSVMAGLTAPRRRVGFFLDGNQGVNNMTAQGLVLFDQAVCYAANNCGPQGPAIIATPLAPRVVCAGDTFSVPFVIRDTFDLANRFYAEISSPGGNFPAVPVRIGNIRARQASRVVVQIPDTMSGTYRIRIVSSAPRIVGDAATSTIIVNRVLVNLPILSDTVCPGTTAQIRLANSQAGGTYQPILNGANFGNAIPGTGDTLRLNVPPISQTGLDTVRFIATVPGCASRPLTQYGLVVSLPLPDTLLHLPDFALCGQDSGLISLTPARLGFEYQFVLDGAPYGPVHYPNSPSQEVFTIYRQDVSPGGSQGRVRVRYPGCSWYMVNDTALIRWAPAINLTVLVDDDTACFGTTATVQLTNTQAGNWYYLSIPGGDSVLATGTTAQIPIQAGLFAPGAYTVSIRVSTSFCGSLLLSDSLHFLQYAQPPVNSDLFIQQQICRGQDVMVRIAPASSDFNYTVYRDGNPETSLNPVFSHDTLSLRLATGTWAVGQSSFRIHVNSPGCNEVELPAITLATIINGPRIDLVTSAPSTCYNDTLRVSVDGSEAGIWYRLAFHGQALGDSVAGNGGTIVLHLPTGLIPTGQTGVQVLASTTGCGAVVLTDTVELNLIPAPAQPLGFTDAILCPGQSGLVLRSTNGIPGALYQLLASNSAAIGTQPTPPSGQVGFQLPGSAFPPGVYTIRIFSRIGSCALVQTSDSFRITIRPTPSLTDTLTATRYCPGGTGQVTLSASSTDFRYQLVGNQGPLGTPIDGTGAPLSWAFPSPGAATVVQVRILNQGCRDTLGLDTALLRPLLRPTGRLQTLSRTTVCPGDSLVTILNGLLGGTTYSLRLSGRSLKDTLVATGAIRLAVSLDAAARGPAKMYLTADGGDCFGQVKLDSVSLNLTPNPDYTSKLQGTKVCQGSPLSIILASPVLGASYQPYIAGQPAGPKVRAASTDTLRLTIVADSLPHDTVYVRVYTRTACDSGFVADSALVIQLRALSYRVRIATSDTLPCINYQGDYSISLEQPGSIRWKLPQHSRAIYSADNQSVHLVWTDYPNALDSLVVTAGFACNAKAKGKLILRQPTTCERVFIPNIMTPNTVDGNQIWDIRGLENFPDYQLEVFNTWGGLVFQSKTAYTPWDGKRNGEFLPSATYYYVLQLGPGRAPITGSITLFNQ